MRREHVLEGNHILEVIQLEDNKIAYMIMCIEKFADAYRIKGQEAFNYLHKHNGLKFLDSHYKAEHLLSLEDAIDDLAAVCRNNGGNL